MARIRTTDDTAATAISKMAAEGSAKKTKALKRELAGTAPYKVNNIKYVVDMLTSVNTASASLARAGEILASISAHEISPDGLIGGRGYVMTIKDIRQDITAAINLVSDLNDSLSDELTNPKWELSPDDVDKYKEQAKSGQAMEELPTDETTEVPAEGGDALGSEETGAPAEDTTDTDVGTPAEEEALPEFFGEGAPESAPTEQVPGTEPATEAATAEPAVATDLPYKKLAALVGRPERDIVARTLRAPILFNILDGHTADNN